MNDTIAKSVAQAPDDQRKAARTFHRACVGEGHKNLRQAASMHLPMALLADFPLAIGLAMEVAAKLTSPKELDRLRGLGHAELSAMGITAIDEERVYVDVVLDAIPDPEDVKSLLALGVKRVRKDLSGLRFNGKASRIQVSALVTRLGGHVTVIEETVRPPESETEEQAGIGQTINGSVAETAQAISDEPPSGLASNDRSDVEPAADAALKESGPFPIPAPRSAPRFPIPPRLGAFDPGPNSSHSTIPPRDGRNVAFSSGNPDDVTKPTGPE